MKKKHVATLRSPGSVTELQSSLYCGLSVCDVWCQVAGPVLRLRFGSLGLVELLNELINEPTVPRCVWK